MSIEIFPDTEALALRAADMLAMAAQEAAAARGRFAVALSGGETPQGAVPHAGAPAVQPEDPLAPGAALLGRRALRAAATIRPATTAWRARRSSSTCPSPPANVHRMLGEEEPAEGGRRLREANCATSPPRSVLPSGVPVFDLVLLGLGRDGHTASLFPRSDALTVEDRFCVATQAPDGSPRLTVTAPVINAARRVWFS